MKKKKNILNYCDSCYIGNNVRSYLLTDSEKKHCKSN